MKAITIYKIKKEYKIVTLYKREAGSYIVSEPILNVSIGISFNDFYNKIFYSLDSSRNISESEEDKFSLGKELLKKLKISSFEKLYFNCTSCSIWLDNNILEIIPNKYAGYLQGLEEDIENKLVFQFNEENKLIIVEKVKDILDKKI